MPIICPTITAYSEAEYREQMEKIVHITTRIQVDLTDGIFTKQKSIGPEQAWWPIAFKTDFHLMYQTPFSAVKTIMEHKPHLIIVHAEADTEFKEIATYCHDHDVRFGLALLQQTSTEIVLPLLEQLDHVLIFSGNLGYQGGSTADTTLLEKVGLLKSLKPELEIGWDGGVNDQNVAELVAGGVGVLNVGGYLQDAKDPTKAYMALQRIADETGTT